MPMNEGITTPPRLCHICGELELVEYRKSSYLIVRAWPVKALKKYEATKPGHYHTLFDQRAWSAGEPKNRGWGLFLNRIDPHFIGPFCCGDCIFTDRDKCIAILGGKPTTDEFLLGGLRERGQSH
jgi:hypothetical protein